ncbi:MAG: hypothetical protein [Microvirus sp.]|nr:MAG: hypothetical protein [Microvirus sp.]
MKFRKKMSRGQSKRSFRKGTGTHKKNIPTTVMRGGIRL